jgi:adenylate kinase
VGLRVVVVGIPGVGKTTVVDSFVSNYRGAKLVNFGSVMLDAGQARKWIKKRDDIRKLPVEKQRRLQEVAATKIARLKERVVVVDTHLFIRTDEGFWPGLPFEVVRALKPTHLILLQATPEEIAKRRLGDTTRYRDASSLEDLAGELELARAFLTVSSTLTGAPMAIVSNEEGRPNGAAVKIRNMLEKAES